MVSSKEEDQAHLETAMLLLTALGFILNLNKSVLTPTQRVTFLRFCMDSRTMLISLPTPRIQSVQLLIRETLAQGQASYLNSWAQRYPLIKQFWEPNCITTSCMERVTLRHSHNYNTVVTTSDNMSSPDTTQGRCKYCSGTW